jgi:hypothetical protein
VLAGAAQVSRLRPDALIDEPSVNSHAASRLGENINPMRPGDCSTSPSTFSCTSTRAAFVFNFDPKP